MSGQRQDGRRGERDAGVTLVELLVVITLLGVIGTLVANTFIAGVRNTTATISRNESAAAARVAFERMTKSLRQAVPPSSTDSALLAAGPSDVTFYTNLRTLVGGVESGPEQVRYWVDGAVAADCPRGNCLRESVAAAVASVAADGTVTYSWPGPASTRVLVRDVVSGSRPLFTYLRPADATLQADGTTTSTVDRNATGTLTAVGRFQAGAVEIWLSVRPPSSVPVPATTAVDRVTLANVTPAA